MILLVARLGLAAVFAVAELRDRAGTSQALGAFGVPVRLVDAGAIALPIAELAVAGLLVATATARTGAIAALVLPGAVRTRHRPLDLPRRAA